MGQKDGNKEGVPAELVARRPVGRRSANATLSLVPGILPRHSSPWLGLFLDVANTHQPLPSREFRIIGWRTKIRLGHRGA
jgi:hypothetical protein